MIVAAFRSEWVKLKRRNLLVGTYFGLAVAASLFAVLLFAQAPWPAEPGAAGPTQRAHPRGQSSRRASGHRGLRDRRHPDRQ